MLLRTEAGLRGSTPADHELWTKFRRRLETMKPGTWMRFEWSTPRNGKHHRKLMALIALITENSEVYDTHPKALVAVKLAAGYFDPFIDPRTGEIVPIPKSISFESMGQEEFDVFYEAALQGVLSVILPHIDHTVADRLLDLIVEGWG